MLAASCLSRVLGLAPWLHSGVHFSLTPLPGSAVQGLGSIAIALLPVFHPLEHKTHLCIYVFNVANGQLNELQFVIFMVNLKSRSCWLILLFGSKTGRDWCAAAGTLIGI